jgi:Domain of unknown function (DUF1996)
VRTGLRRHALMDARTARLFTVIGVLAAFGAVTVLFVSGGGRNSASAEASLDSFVPIEQVAPNVWEPQPQGNASTGVFTVDCGVNENGKFSPDNPVAQPGIKNGAEHVHDFVGNLAITADTSNEELDASDTTCKNGDRSSYFWPVVRIDRSVRAGDQPQNPSEPPVVACPPVGDQLPAVPEAARWDINRSLIRLDNQIADANRRLRAHGTRINAEVNRAIEAELRQRRAATLSRLASALRSYGVRPRGMVSMVDCQVSYDSMHANHGSGNGTRSAKSAATPTVACPTVRNQLPKLRDGAVGAVNRNLARLGEQIAAANEFLVRANGRADRDNLDRAVMRRLASERAATINQIMNAIGQRADRGWVDSLAGCALRNGGPQGRHGQGQGQHGQGQGQGQPGAQPSESASPLPEPSGPNLELPNNTGGIVRPASVKIDYRGNPTTKVGPMPRFLRQVTGDAKPTSRGPANARASWTCSGFDDRLSDKYPICPEGSQVLRVHDFAGCWDGQNIDSENHRAHVAFADRNTGECPDNFQAIPQLRITIAYDIPQDVQQKGQFALDSFPEENHNPFSDHNDFVNVNSDEQMRKIVDCINSGQNCD